MTELGHFLNHYWHVEDGGAEYLHDFRRGLARLKEPSRAIRFKQELANAIVNGTVSRQDFERWTLQDFDTDQELVDELMAIWTGLYGTDDPLAFRR